MQQSPIRPAADAFAIAAGAGALATPIRGIYVGVAGDVTVTMPSGASVQFVNLASGVIHWIAATHVTAATAASIVGIPANDHTL
jgi:hypothetical protein